MDTAKPVNVIAWLIMSMNKIAPIMDVSTLRHLPQIKIYTFLVFSKARLWIPSHYEVDSFSIWVLLSYSLQI